MHAQLLLEHVRRADEGDAEWDDAYVDEDERDLLNNGALWVAADAEPAGAAAECE